jgi:hypothetical protein
VTARPIPLPGARALARAARRTVLVRGALAAAAVVLVLLAAQAGRHPGVRRPSALPVRSGDLIVLDLSASISSDTFSRIADTLRKLVATGGRYGLVVFSDVAYEALPPGTPASALRPLVRYFAVPPSRGPGAAQALPRSPWTSSFSRGTEISAGLDLAHRIVLADGLRHARVVLISDLADDPEDLQRLNEVATAEYGPGRTPLRVVALNASPADEAFFQRIADAAVAEAPAPAAKPPAAPPAVLPGALPAALAAAIVAALAALALYGLWSARLPLEDTGR